MGMIKVMYPGVLQFSRYPAPDPCNKRLVFCNWLSTNTNLRSVTVLLQKCELHHAQISAQLSFLEVQTAGFKMFLLRRWLLPIAISLIFDGQDAREIRMSF